MTHELHLIRVEIMRAAAHVGHSKGLDIETTIEAMGDRLQAPDEDIERALVNTRPLRKPFKGKAVACQTISGSVAR